VSEAICPVLIVGGGPVGLTAALLLARYGVAARLVERHPSTSIHPRARGLNVRTMEIYRALGLEDAIRSAGADLSMGRSMLFVDTLAGHEIQRIRFDDHVADPGLLARISPCDWRSCAQDELEPLLVEAALRHGAELRFGAALAGFAQDPDGVTATVIERTTGDTNIVRASYLIAADGAASSVREALGVAMTGRGSLDHCINIYFRADLRDLVRGRWFTLCFVQNPAAPGLILAVNNSDRWLFNLTYRPEEGVTPADFTAERCIDLIRKAVGLPALGVEILSVLPWEAAARMAERFSVGRVFLAGDAAHVMPPTGGFGLNTGVQDAHNLAWKLAAIIRGEAGPALLETYDAERRPVARIVTAKALQELDAMRGGGAHATTSTPGDGEPINLLVAVLGYRYASRTVSASDDDLPTGNDLDLTGRPGTRAPHVWLKRGETSLSTLDLFLDRFVLLGGTEAGPWCDGARAAANRMGVGLDVWRVGPWGDLIDRDGDWCSAYGVTPPGAVIVRPDGFVAWRSRSGSASSEAEIVRVLGHLLCRSPGPDHDDASHFS
jgi:putative polyketide hydroxylase